jgi:hypothetical protein
LIIVWFQLSICKEALVFFQWQGIVALWFLLSVSGIVAQWGCIWGEQQIWRRIILEISVEVPLLIEKWPYILFGLIFQVNSWCTFL